MIWWRRLSFWVDWGAMTVKELIEKLKSFPSEMEVNIYVIEYGEYFDIKSFGFDDLGKAVEIEVEILDDEY